MDFFNALPPSEEGMVDMKRNDTHLTFVARRTIGAGTQILVPYGKYHILSNGQLLMDYGFVFPQNDKGNSIFIPFHLFKNTEKYEEKLELLKKIQLSNDDNFPVRLGEPLSDELLVSYRISVLTPKELKKVLREPTLLSSRVSNQNELKVKERILTVAKALLASYKTTLEEDKNLDKESLPIRARMAVQIRMEEKVILLDLIEKLEEDIEIETYYEKNIL